MHIEFAFLCESAVVNPDRTLTANRIFNAIFTDETPVKLSAGSLYFRLRMDNSEAGDHSFSVSLHDRAGYQIGIASTPVVLGRSLEPFFAFEDVSQNLSEIGQIPAVGDYRLEIRIDGVLHGDVPFIVRPLA